MYDDYDDWARWESWERGTNKTMLQNYWLPWFLLTIIKLGMLIFSNYAAIEGILHPEYSLLAILFAPLSLLFIYDFAWQLLVPFIGGEGNRNHKPSDTPIFMGLAPSSKEAKQLPVIPGSGKNIIWS